ncbi:MAG: EB domain-containing protein [Polyangiales bacterium]
MRRHRLHGTCTPLPTDGEACVDGAIFRNCAGGHACVEGTCRQMRRIGGDCEADEQCYSGNCDGGTCAEAPLCGAE